MCRHPHFQLWLQVPGGFCKVHHTPCNSPHAVSHPDTTPCSFSRSDADRTAHLNAIRCKPVLSVSASGTIHLLRPHLLVWSILVTPVLSVIPFLSIVTAPASVQLPTSLCPLGDILL